MSRVRGPGFGVAIVVLTVAVIAGVVTGIQHIPHPTKKIEWVHSGESIIVQMKTVPGLPQPQPFNRARVPSFTLYGDGTLILTDPAKEGTDAPVLQARLSDGEIRDLLSFVNDNGFMNFAYAQPKPDVPDFPTTYVYVGLKETANAVSAYALNQPAPDDKQWSQFRKLQQIKSRLDKAVSTLMNEGGSKDYPADPMILFVGANPPTSVNPPDWPVPLGTIAGESGIGERRLEGDLARDVQQKLGPVRGSMFLRDSNSFSVAYRPVLPHEDNFPEFEPPQ